LQCSVKYASADQGFMSTPLPEQVPWRASRGRAELQKRHLYSFDRDSGTDHFSPQPHHQNYRGTDSPDSRVQGLRCRPTSYIARSHAPVLRLLAVRGPPSAAAPGCSRDSHRACGSPHGATGGRQRWAPCGCRRWIGAKALRGRGGRSASARAGRTSAEVPAPRATPAVGGGTTPWDAVPGNAVSGTTPCTARVHWRASMALRGRALAPSAAGPV